MEKLRLVYVLNTTERTAELLTVLADSVEQRNGWIFAFSHNQMVGAVREEHLKAFYFEADK